MVHADKSYYVLLQGTMWGPYSIQEVTAIAFEPFDQVYKIGSGFWHSPADLPELQAHYPHPMLGNFGEARLKAGE